MYKMILKHHPVINTGVCSWEMQVRSKVGDKPSGTKREENPKKTLIFAVEVKINQPRTRMLNLFLVKLESKDKENSKPTLTDLG